jgi:hypothetical protein
MIQCPMPRTATIELPLRDLRRAANVTEGDMARFLSLRTGKNVSEEYVMLLERRGTRNVDYIAAYAELTGKPILVVSDAAKKPEKYLSN